MATENHWALVYETKQRLAAIPAGPDVIIRKKPILLQGDPVPCLIVSPGKVVNTSDYFENKVERQYEVQVTYIRSGDRDYGEIDCRNVLRIESLLRDELFQPVLDNTQSIDANLVEKPSFEVASGDRNNYDISGYIVRHILIDTRKS